MLQAVMVAPGKIEFREVARPAPGEGEVLIQVKRIGVCGSDIHVYHGKHPYTSYPVVQGHEVSGVIAEVGPGVEGLAVGDRVTFLPQVTCGTCYQCTHGMYHLCESLKVMGFQTGGAAQEYFPVAADRVLRIPESVSLDEAAMIEPLAVAVHAVGRTGGVQGKRVVVLGAGTIGNLVGQVAKASGAEAVLITDINGYKLDKARACGMDVVVNTHEEALGAAIRRAFGPDGADLILECVGVSETINQAIDNARKGSTVVMVGVAGAVTVTNFGYIQDHELNVRGTLMYQKPDFERAIALVAAQKVHLTDLITHRFDFRHYLDAYHTIESSGGHYVKVMIEVA